MTKIEVIKDQVRELEKLLELKDRRIVALEVELIALKGSLLQGNPKVSLIPTPPTQCVHEPDGTTAGKCKHCGISMLGQLLSKGPFISVTNVSQRMLQCPPLDLSKPRCAFS